MDDDDDGQHACGNGVGGWLSCRFPPGNAFAYDTDLIIYLDERGTLSSWHSCTVRRAVWESHQIFWKTCLFFNRILPNITVVPWYVVPHRSSTDGSLKCLLNSLPTLTLYSSPASTSSSALGIVSMTVVWFVYTQISAAIAILFSPTSCAVMPVSGKLKNARAAASA